MEKSTKNSQGIKPKIGREYKFWHDWSDEDFRKWLRTTGFLSSRYRILHLVAGLMLLVIGILEIIDGSIFNGVAFTGLGIVILFFLVLGNKVAR